MDGVIRWVGIVTLWVLTFIAFICGVVFAAERNSSPAFFSFGAFLTLIGLLIQYHKAK